MPPDGRSSVETLNGSMGAFLNSLSTVNPIVDFEMLAVLKKLWIFNPDFSQYVANIVNLGNPGHKLSVVSASDAVAERAVNRLNESAARIYRLGAGVDSLINAYLTSIAWAGAISSEDVVNLGAKRVEKVVLVPVEQIRFKYNGETDEYEAFQAANALLSNQSQLGLIRLNPATYCYFPLSTIENSPYAKPPGTAAVETIIESQQPMMENIRFMAQKFGLLGLVTASVVPPPRKPNESEAEYQGRSKIYLGRVREALEGNLGKGLLVGYRDQKIEHTDLSGGTQGVYDVNRISEEQVFSGLAAMPGFHGRTDSTTETFADVVYFLLTAQVENMQRLVKRRQERTYMLDLRLAGIEVDSVKVEFNRIVSRNALAEAQTEELRQKIVFNKVTSGLITPDQAAQELGYKFWFDSASVQNLIGSASQSRKLNLNFNDARQNYEFEPERIELNTGGETRNREQIISFPEKKKAIQLRACNH